MSPSDVRTASLGGRGRAGPIVLAATGLALALGTGLALGNPTPEGTTLAAAVLGLVIIVLAAVRPWAGFLVLISSSMMLIVVLVTHMRAANLFDLLLVPVFAATMLGPARREARRGDAEETGETHERIRAAEHRFTTAARMYFAVALVSLIPGLLLGRAWQSLDSALVTLRDFQGIALYPLGVWWLRSMGRVRQAVGALFVGGAMFTVINAVALAGGVKRAGITWIVNYTSWPITSPNEGAAAMVLLWALVFAYSGTRPRALYLLALPILVLMLVLTQSRSGLLAWLTFNLLSARWVRLRHVLIGLVVVALTIPFVPATYWERIARTLALKPGSFEALSTLIRFYSWKAAWHVFLDHPILGVGYLCFRFVSRDYHGLPFVIGTAENIFLEIAAGMGVVGLVALGVAIHRMFRLGATIRRATPEHTFGHQLARYHSPILFSLLVANLTANNWTGLVGLGQLAIWFALLVRAGHLAVREAGAA